MERTRDPWMGTTYNGFSGMGPPAAAARRETPRRRPTGPLIAAGVAVAATLGLGFGLLTRDDLGREPPPPDPPSGVTEPASAVPVEVAPVATPPKPTQAAAPLEVLPPDMARAATAQAMATPVPRRVPAPPPRQMAEVAVAPPATPASARVAEPSPAPAPRPDPGFDCRHAGTRSERLVCGDAELARLDRRLNRAFEQAVASGVPYRALRADQDDWLRIREDAARRAGPGGVASVYRQRIAELREMAGAY